METASSPKTSLNIKDISDFTTQKTTTIYENCWNIRFFSISQVLFSHMTPLLGRLMCCFHGNHQTQSITFVQAFTAPTQHDYSLFPLQMTQVLDSCCFVARFWYWETTKTSSDLNGLPKNWIKTLNHISHVMVLQYYVDTCKYNISQKITSTYNSTCKRCLTVWNDYMLVNYSWENVNQM